MFAKACPDEWRDPRKARKDNLIEDQPHSELCAVPSFVRTGFAFLAVKQNK